jgi:hypothetical protein
MARKTKKRRRTRSFVTRDVQIQSALELLEPQPDRRDECERDVKRALRIIKLETTAGVVGSKKYKIALRSFQKVLERAEAARKKLIGLERMWTEEGDDEDLLPLGFNQWIAYCERQLGPQPRRRVHDRRAGNPKYLAADWAKDLLVHWGHEASIRRGGRWARLAAVLYGDPEADLYHVLSWFRRPRVMRPSLSYRRPRTGSE